jgi:hypothetical protein
MQGREEEKERETRSLLLSLLNSNPSMIQRPGGNSFGLNPSLLEGYPSVPSFSSRNNMQGMHLGASMLMNQFPSQRLPVSFTNHSRLLPQRPSDAHSILGMTSGVKRMADPAQSASKRRKEESIQGSITKDNPVLMERLSSMSGFRMPKWGGAGGKQVQRLSGDGNSAKRLLPKHGAFPMPGVTETNVGSKWRYSLDKFAKLWNETDQDIRTEVLARRLERTNVSIPPRNYRQNPRYS